MRQSINAYKLLRLRKDGTLGPLFINIKQRIPIKRWLKAESHLTKGYAFRPGWHATSKPFAPHLSMKGRVWCKVKLKGTQKYNRPRSQGGLWLLAKHMMVVEIIK